MSLHILLAEDNAVNQKIAVAMLNKLGHTVEVVDNGCKAVAAVTASNYDLVLMDVQMPEMSGLDATAEIRRQEKQGGCRHVPIIALTAHAMKGDAEKCVAAGMDGYLSKPIRQDALAKTINQTMASTGHPPVTSDGPARPAAGGSALFDESVLFAMAGDLKHLDQTVDNLIEDLRTAAEQLDSAMASADSTKLMDAAGNLKERLWGLSARPALAAVLNLMNVVRGGILQSAEREVSAVKEQLSLLQDALKQHQKESSLCEY